MSVKFTNNAVASLAAGISTSDTTLPLLPGTGDAFPVLAAGDWFPVTLVTSGGAFEIARCTERAGDVLTVVRAQEGTAAKTFPAGSRVEHRLTAAVLEAIISDVLARLPLAGGEISGALTVAGALAAASLNTSGAITQNGAQVWHTANLNPGAYLPLAGGSMTGHLTISNTAPQVIFADTDWGTRTILANSGTMGFVGSDGNYKAYSQNDGTFVAAGNIGAYSDRKHKKDIEPIGSALALVERMRGVWYTDRRTGAARVGVIAQEMQEVLPQVVGAGPDGLHVDYGNLAAVLIPAIQELAAEVRMMNRGL